MFFISITCMYFFNDCNIFANTSADNRYSVLEGEKVSVLSSDLNKISKIEIEGNTVSKNNRLSENESLGELYVDKHGNPILDSNNQKQYKINIVTTPGYSSYPGINNYKDFDKMISTNPWGSWYTDNHVFEITENTNEIKIGLIRKNKSNIIGGLPYLRVFATIVDNDGNKIKDVKNYMLYKNEPKDFSFEDVITDLNQYKGNKLVISFRDITGPDVISNYNMYVINTSNDSFYPINENEKPITKSILLPSTLNKVGESYDKLIWSPGKNKYIIEKINDLNETSIIETNISNKIRVELSESGITYIHATSGNVSASIVRVEIDRLNELALKAVINFEQNPIMTNLSLARDLVNQVKESLLKDKLQERLNSISSIKGFDMENRSESAMIDLYIKSENMLSLSANTNSISFNDFSGIEDAEKLNAINLIISSSLPYKINTYLIGEIQNADKSKSMDKSILNIKANSESKYNTFADISSPITLLDNQSKGNNITHGIDIKLKGGLAYQADVYKTVVKFEVVQK